MSQQVVPSYHLLPKFGWLNDPNGLVHKDGRWHQFYQHNSAGPWHEAIEWGHASTADLVHWDHHPVAFGPTPSGPDSFGCWSGCAVTGLDRPAVVYSGVTDESHQSTIVLRWGSDDLERWGEPLVVGTTPTDPDAAVRVMRDPYVFEWSGRRWGLIGAGLTDGSAAVLVYSCDDILDWHYEGRFLDNRDAQLARDFPADIWECPQLVVAEDGSALLVVSIQLRGELCDVAGISGTLTESDGHPVFRASGIRHIDEGNAFYAPQLVPDPTGADPLMFGWVRQEGFPDAFTTGHTNAGCMSLPRRVNVSASGFTVRLDPATDELDVPTVDVGGIGGSGGSVGVLPDTARLTSSTPFILRGRRGDEQIEVHVDAGSTVWVDADVVEIAPPAGETVAEPAGETVGEPAGEPSGAKARVPSTLRGATGTWTVEITTTPR